MVTQAQQAIAANIAVYNGSAPILTDQQLALLQVDVNGNTKITLATLIAGEDLPNNVLKVEERFSYTNIAGTSGTVTVKTGAGFLHNLVINTPVASDVITLFDSAGTSTTTIGKITLPGTLLTQGPMPALYNVSFSNGLTVAHTGTSNITISNR